MFPEKYTPYVLDEIAKRLEALGFVMNDWVIDYSKSSPLGHGYQLDGVYYGESDYIYVFNKSNKKDFFSLWIDFAFVPSMKKPLLYLVYMHPFSLASDPSSQKDWERNMIDNEKLFEKYRVRERDDPKTFLQEQLTSEQYEELLLEPAFSKLKAK